MVVLTVFTETLQFNLFREFSDLLLGRQDSTSFDLKKSPTITNAITTDIPGAKVNTRRT